MSFADRLRPVRRLVAPVEAREIRRFGRSVISTVSGVPVLVLVTTGRRTGRPRHTPLAYAELDGVRHVVGGAGGQSTPPDWAANLRAHPAASIVVDRRAVDVRATELLGDERAAIWERLRGPFPQIDDYATKAGRVIPVFRLDPR